MVTSIIIARHKYRQEILQGTSLALFPMEFSTFGVSDDDHVIRYIYSQRKQYIQVHIRFMKISFSLTVCKVRQKALLLPFFEHRVCRVIIGRTQIA